MADSPVERWMRSIRRRLKMRILTSIRFHGSGKKLDKSRWLIANDDGKVEFETIFGLEGAIPVTGDWDGDGTDQVGVFIAGYWFLDLNGDGVWDDSDLWIRLGEEGDQPVTGDWDGDGEDRRRHLRSCMGKRPTRDSSRTWPTDRRERAGWQSSRTFHPIRKTRRSDFAR